MRRGTVFYKNKAAGILEEDDEGYRFTYLPEWLSDPGAEPVSLTLPLSKAEFHSPTMFPFFDGLIPEGWLLSVAEDNWKLSPRDRMGLLLTLCRDCIGAVSIEPGVSE
jgi:serine/threonine-protein kinase HipA